MRILTRIWRVWLRFELLRQPIPGIRISDPKTLTPVWQLAGNDGIDPMKEINAAEKGVALGVMSRSRFVADRGGDFREIAQELAEEQATLDELGLLQKPEPPPGEPQGQPDEEDEDTDGNISPEQTQGGIQKWL